MTFLLVRVFGSQWLRVATVTTTGAFLFLLRIPGMPLALILAARVTFFDDMRRLFMTDLLLVGRTRDAGPAPP